MGTTSDKLNRLNQTKQGIKAFLISEGQTVTNNDTFYSYISKLQNTHKELGPKTVNHNGIYNPADDNLDGYNALNINVKEGNGIITKYYMKKKNTLAETYVSLEILPYTNQTENLIVISEFDNDSSLSVYINNL